MSQEIFEKISGIFKKYKKDISLSLKRQFDISFLQFRVWEIYSPGTLSASRRLFARFCGPFLPVCENVWKDFAWFSEIII